MLLWYNFIDKMLPFEWAQYLFMKNALLGVLLITPLFGLLGTMIVNNRMAFFSDALGHSALTGIALGVIIGLRDPLGAMICFSLLLSVLILIVKTANTASTDTIIGVFSSAAVALGIVILSSRGGFNKYSVYLVGDILSINPADLLRLAVVFAVVVFFWVMFFNKLLLVSINGSLAGSRGINVRFYEYLFTLLIAFIVTISIQWVGILIINSLLILPAAAARNIAGDMRQYHLYAVVVSVVSGLAGLILSYFWGTAAGATIVLIAAFFYAITFAVNLLRR